MSLVEASDSTTGDFHSAAWLRFQALAAAADTLLAASDDAHLARPEVAALLVALVGQWSSWRSLRSS